jgi:hypothetical protein
MRPEVLHRIRDGGLRRGKLPGLGLGQRIGGTRGDLVDLRKSLLERAVRLRVDAQRRQRAGVAGFGLDERLRRLVEADVLVRRKVECDALGVERPLLVARRADEDLEAIAGVGRRPR